jgi:hypothetical protein
MPKDYPTPWRFCRTENPSKPCRCGLFWNTVYDVAIFSVTPYHDDVVAASYKDWTEQDFSHFRLIETAPHLLEVARMALTPERDAYGQLTAWHERLRAAAQVAIAKAEGHQ